MNKALSQAHFKGSYNLNICGSKSESNRLLILKKLYPVIDISNLSTSDDTDVLIRALESKEELIDIHHAGTAMRFLTAYFAFNTERKIILTGSQRMQNRPIKILVDALKALGAKIEYAKNHGFPPLIIHPSKIEKDEVSLQANISSQYISALMLSAPQLPKGLKINFTTETTSLPYLEMTVQMMQNLGIKIEYGKDFIQVMPTKAIRPVKIAVESDWSSASYFYSLVALSPDLKLSLNTFKEESLQGDSELAEIYKQFGVKTTFLNNAIELELNKGLKSSDKSIFQLNLNASPDLAQTIAVTCLGLNIPCNLTGLHTLKIKETDRLLALKIELEKLGAKVNIGDDFLFMEPGMSLIADQHIDTYNDHRMAMAFAPLMTKTSLVINNAEVVSKSYRGFWQDLIKISG